MNVAGRHNMGFGSVRAKILVMVKHILRKCGHPPDVQAKARVTALEKSELLCADWAK